MEKDLKDQEAFYNSGQTPAAQVVRESDAEKESRNPKDMSSSIPQMKYIASPIGEIKERTIKDSIEGKKASFLPTAFPKAVTIPLKNIKRVGKKSLFKQSREQASEMNKAIEDSTRQTISLSLDDQLKMDRSISKEVKAEEIQRDVDRILGEMSASEIEEARRELLETVDPKLVAFLMKRSQYKELRSKSAEVPIVQERREKEASEVEEARQIANSLDYTRIRSEKDLEDAVQLLPQLEKQKLEWTQSVPRQGGQSKGIRFNFEGVVVTNSSEYPISCGLYNHGDEPNLAGYTIREFCLLARSQLIGQRKIALMSIYNILRRRNDDNLSRLPLHPAKLPIVIVKTLLFLLEHSIGEDDLFLALRCMEELCEAKEELHRRLLLAISSHGYEYAYIQDKEMIGFEEEEEEDDRIYKNGNCGNMYKIFKELNVIAVLFQQMKNHGNSNYRGLLFSVIRTLLDNSIAISADLVESDSLFYALETVCETELDPSLLLSSSQAILPPSTPSYRLEYIVKHSEARVSSAIQFLLIIESLVRQSRKNALHVYHSVRIMKALKQWFAFYTNEIPSTNVFEINAIVESVLSIWRLLLLYDLDTESIDSFLPALLKIIQYGSSSSRVIGWSILGISVWNKRKVKKEYFIEYCNILNMLAIEVIKEEKGNEEKELILGSVWWYIGSYMECVKECEEEWKTTSTDDGLYSQIYEFGTLIVQMSSSWLSRMNEDWDEVVLQWNRKERNGKSPFSGREYRYLVHSNLYLSYVFVLFQAIQLSTSFGSFFMASPAISSLYSFTLHSYWSSLSFIPHSLSYTYLQRSLSVAQSYSALLLHSLLPLMPSLSSLPSNAHYSVYVSAWHIIQGLLPGDEYMALLLMMNILFHASSLQLYCGGVIPGCLIDLFIQQLGDGKLVEHSQSLYNPSHSDISSLLLLPHQLAPTLPLQSYWILLPLLKLRFRKVGDPTESPCVLSTKDQAISYFAFVNKMIIMTEPPLSKDGAMIGYALLHFVLAGQSLLEDVDVTNSFFSLFRSLIRDPHSTDAIQKMDEAVPKKEILSFIEKACNVVIEEYYGCTVALQILLHLLCPCRDWNYRVLILNTFYDREYGYLLIEEDAREWNTVDEDVKESYARYKKSFHCPWEENEEMIVMYIRYLQQAAPRMNKNPNLMKNRCLFTVLHYIGEKKTKYLYYAREVECVLPTIDIKDILMYLSFVKKHNRIHSLTS